MDSLIFDVLEVNIELYTTKVLAVHVFMKFKVALLRIVDAYYQSSV